MLREWAATYRTSMWWSSGSFLVLVSIFIQRAGRAARAYGRTGVAILLVEPSAYTIDLAKEAANPVPVARGHKKSQAKEKESEAEKRRKAQERKTHAKSRGAKRGAAGGKHDAIFVHDTPTLGSGGTERRPVFLTEIYENKPAPAGPYASGRPPTVPRQSAVKRGEVNEAVQAVLHNWRLAIKARDYPTPLFNASAIMRDETIALLASVGPLNSQDHLAKVLAGQWTWWDKYGGEVKPRAKRAPEREPEVEGGSTSKRQRGNEPSIAISTPTPAGTIDGAKNAYGNASKGASRDPRADSSQLAQMEAESEQNRRLASLFTFQTPK
ncbi:hypothetical protein C8J57DRAFT_1257543 [Mycena rebaudengoi]|nr:hypothetical protein C8J57DRAFT_1257543 [Mycena rebaudengoi]